MNIPLRSEGSIQEFLEITAPHDQPHIRPDYRTYHLRTTSKDGEEDELTQVSREEFAKGLRPLAKYTPTHEAWIVTGRQGMHCDFDLIDPPMPKAEPERPEMEYELVERELAF